MSMPSEARAATQPTRVVDVSPPMITGEQEAAILHAASEVVAAAVGGRPATLMDPQIAGAADTPVFGCFVSIKRRGRLRGCCGFLGRRERLLSAVLESAHTSAIGDARLPRIVSEELPHLEFEVWLLHSQQEVAAVGDERVSMVEIGRHGLQIQRGESRGLLLPGVAIDHDLDAQAFLQHVSVKAGLSPTAWREADTKLATFEGHVVRGFFAPQVASTVSASVVAPPRFSPQDLSQLADFCRDNIVALMRGATPSYYLFGVTDGNVHGYSLRIHLGNADQPISFEQFTLRNPVPLQATLFQCCESAGAQLKREGLSTIAPQHVRVELAVMYDPAPQGTAAAPDLDGFDPAHRGLMVHSANRSVWHHQPDRSAEEHVQTICHLARLTIPDEAALYSFRVQATRVPWQVVQVPTAERGGEVRPPAVAGMFYPADSAQLDEQLDQLQPTDTVERQSWHAALVPHAGLKYSGRIAADVLRRVAIPETVIVLGPKHTRQGVDWAVAPHRSWMLPGRVVESDVALAEQLAECIDGLELDAVAHQREHAIEVELPWFARFAPRAKVVGIAIGPANLRHCQRFASQLADVLRPQLDRTLLVISTDMNHFASDAETRRIDSLALEALQALDPERLYHTVRDNQISMCGMIPACIVLSTLQILGHLSNCQQVAYGTSADVTGDPSRVVGYAGMLFR
jgi:AmmeMemoRadiSam system protein B/AmmeMemoRadiSam system protein A